MPTYSEIESLVNLLEDPDPAIHKPVYEHIVSLGEAAIPLIDEFRVTIRNAEMERTLSDILHRITFPGLEQEFLVMMDLGFNSIHDLEMASLLLCRMAYPTLRTELYSRRISALSQELWAALHDAETPTDEVRIITEYLFIKSGFKGPETAKHNAEHSYLHRVIDTRTGIPLSLSLLALFVTNRLNVHLYGVNFPFHFLLATEIDGQTLYIDPTAPDRLLTRDECDKFLLLNGLQPSSQYYQIADPSDMLARLMRNLLAAYQDENDTLRYHHTRILLEHLLTYTNLKS